MESRKESFGLIKLESERLGAHLNSLPTGSLSRDSACEGWTVGDVAAHLVWFAEFCLDVIPRGLKGDISPPKDFPPAGTATDEWMNEYFLESAIARRDALGDELLPVFAECFGQLHDLLADLSPQDREITCYLETGNRPAKAFVDMTINELAIHGWDMLSRLEPSPQMSPELLPVLIVRLRQLFLNPRPVGFLLGSMLPRDLRYRFDVTGVASRKLDIVVEGHMCRIEDATSDKSESTFQCDAQTFVLLMNRRLTLSNLSAAH